MMGAILTLLLEGKITTTKQIVGMIIIHSLERRVDDVSIEPLFVFYRRLLIEIYPIITTSHHN